MPYICNKKGRREELLAECNPKTAGELNYMLTILVQNYLEVNGKSYQTFNDAIGALTACQLEFYRRLVGPYENVKAVENGDVYD